jgi:hypothetical protein
MRWYLLGKGHKSEPGNPGPSLWTCHSPGAASTTQHGSPDAVVMGSERRAEDSGASIKDTVPSSGDRRSEQVISGEISRVLCHL